MVRCPKFHLAYLQEGRKAVQKWSAQQSKEALAVTITVGAVQGACQLQLATNTGAWMTVQPSTVNVTELGAQER